MNRIRLATPEEIEAIKMKSDLDDSCIVLALSTQQGVPTAVVRTAVEVDPVIYPEGLHDRMKAMFQRDIETVLEARGVKKYYFNVHVSNTAMLEVAKTLGAEQMSTEPEYRFRVIL
jgi:hypothetical protein